MKRESWDPQLGDELNLAVPQRQPPADLEDRLMQKVAETRQGRRSSGRVWGPLAAAAILLLAAGNVWQWAARPIPPKPGLLVAVLSSPGSKPFGTMVLDPDDNHGILAVRDLPVAAEGQYQLWLQKGEVVRSAGVFSVNADGYGSLDLTVPAPVLGFQEFFLTLEPRGGSPLPSAAPVLAGRL